MCIPVTEMLTLTFSGKPLTKRPRLVRRMGMWLCVAVIQTSPDGWHICEGQCGKGATPREAFDDWLRVRAQ